MNKKQARRHRIRTLLVLFTLVFSLGAAGFGAHAQEITPGPVVSEGGGEVPVMSEAPAVSEPPYEEPEPPAESVPSYEEPEPPAESVPSYEEPEPEGPGYEEPDPPYSEPTYEEPEPEPVEPYEPPTYIDPTYDDDNDPEAPTENLDPAPEISGLLSDDPYSRAPSANSEDWSDVLEGIGLTSSPETVSTASTASGSAVGGVVTDENQISTLFIAGIVLVVAAVAGIALFVYFQFFWRRRGGSPAPAGGRPPRGGSGPDEEGEDPSLYTTAELSHMRPVQPNRPTPPPTVPLTPRPASSVRPVTDDTIDHFTDINSSSDGLQHREEYEDFVARNKPPIIPKEASLTAPPVHAPSIVLGSEDDEATRAKRAQASAAARRAAEAYARQESGEDLEAPPQAHRKAPPLTSNAIPHAVRGRPTASARPAVSHPAAPAPKPAAPAKPAAPSQTDTFDWDAFLDENRKS